MKRKWKRVILAVLSAVCLVTGTEAGVFAIVTDETSEVVNHFQVGNVQTEIVENIEGYGTKNVKIANTGENNCLIRARVAISPSDANVTLMNWNLGDAPGTWRQAADGYYYFNGVVPAKGNAQKYYTTTALFEGYQIAGVNADGTIQEGYSIPEFEITVTQEAVLSCVTDKEGNVINAYDSNGKYDRTAAEKIWTLYCEPDM